VPTKTADVVRWENNTANGRISLSSLERIDPFQWDFDLLGAARMYPPAARAMSALLSDARRAGHFFKVKYSYRTIAVQWIKWRLFGSPRAAFPGTSNHGDALSCDLTDISSSDIAWLRSNAHRYGFYNDVWYESWHWTYFGGWEDRMTEEERRRFNALIDRVKNQGSKIQYLEAERNRIVGAFEAYLDGRTTLSPLAKPTRRKVFRALRRATRLPEPSPDPVESDLPDPEDG
jgi:hypothetical protein